MQTTEDLLNAVKYAEYYLLKHKYETYKALIPHIFNNTTWKEENATSNDFYIPPTLNAKCKIASLKFTANGCKRISCFPYLPSGKTCSKIDDTVYIQSGNTSFMACQPSCYHLKPEDEKFSPFDTEYYNGKCVLQNSHLKRFAMDPTIRADTEIAGITNVDVGFDYVNDKIYLNKYYCDYYSRTLYAGECVSRNILSDFFLGQYITAQLHPPRNFELPLKPLVPNHLKNVELWTGNRRGKRSIEQQTDIGFSELLFNNDILLGIVQGIAADTAIELSITATKYVLTKMIPKFLTQSAIQLARSFGTKTLIAMSIHLVSAKLLSTSIAFLGALSSACTVVGIAYFLVSFSGMIADMIDTHGYNNCFTQKQLDEMSINLNNKYNDYMQIYDRNNFDITPEMVFDYLELDRPANSTYFELGLEKVFEYLNNLDVNSLSQRMTENESRFQKKREELVRKRDNYNLKLKAHITTNLLATFITIIFGLLFTKYIMLFSFAFMFFMIYYNYYIFNYDEIIKYEPYK